MLTVVPLHPRTAYYLSPAANVLVGANGALKLGDLGLGRQLSEQTMEAFSKVRADWEGRQDVWGAGSCSSSRGLQAGVESLGHPLRPRRGHCRQAGVLSCLSLLLEP